MDEILAERYMALYNRYSVNEASYQTKIFLRNWIESYPNRFRPDAIYFLIVNFDQMIIRPHAGTVEDLEGNLLDRYEGQTESDLVPNIGKAIDIILTPLIEVEGTDPISAHMILKSIDKNWEFLQALFDGWG